MWLKLMDWKEKGGRTGHMRLQYHSQQLLLGQGTGALSGSILGPLRFFLVLFQTLMLYLHFSSF